MEVADGLRGVLLDLVGDHDVADVGAVGGHVQDGARDLAGGSLDAGLGQELLVAHKDLLAVDRGADAVARLVRGVGDALGVELA